MKYTAALALMMVGLSKAYDSMLEANFTMYNFTQKLDHFNFTLRNLNFTQRYWVNDNYFENKTGPVFLYICGEGTCRPPTERAYPFQVC
jgi:hypothetical protein